MKDQKSNKSPKAQPKQAPKKTTPTASKKK
jgi:hypothetical protein